jgi:hypothetical protein
MPVSIMLLSLEGSPNLNSVADQRRTSVPRFDVLAAHEKAPSNYIVDGGWGPCRALCGTPLQVAQGAVDLFAEY